ncbi:MAG TPA: hypothetical protein PLP34_04755 [Chitinophagaceae bacterium]|nr:hypothetical protein [Chitinophagaceae bacterium]HNF71700.1 hypothetical protein [Chitinophagaceae bacterium]
MKPVFFLILCNLSLFSHAQNSGDFIVTDKQDTLYYSKPIEADHEMVSRWKKIRVMDQIISIHHIRFARINGLFYANCNGQQLLQQKIHGKINVYANADINNNRDSLKPFRGPAFIQKNNEPYFLPLHPKNILRLITDQDSLHHMYQVNLRNRNAGKALIISGVSAGVPLVVFGTFFGLLSETFGDDEMAGDSYLAAAIGALTGAGLIGGGVGLSQGNPPPNLNTILEYNQLP